MQLSGARVLITGASAGIGQACAWEFARAGARVALMARSVARLERLAAELTAAGAEVLVSPGDVAQRADLINAAGQVRNRWGGLDVLVNNAGVGLYAPVAEMDEALFRRAWEVNVMGCLYAIQAAVPLMAIQRKGLIINVSSVAGKRATPITAGYAATKHALTALSDGLRVELRPLGIQVLAVYPGLTKTEFQTVSLRNPGQQVAPDRGVSPERVARRILRGARLGRAELFITPWDHAYITANALLPRLVDIGMRRLLHQRWNGAVIGPLPAPRRPEFTQGEPLGRQ